jgi:hypothetical protein
LYGGWICGIDETDPEGPYEGFVDPTIGKVRTIPLEIMVDGDSAPIYVVQCLR